MLWYLRWCCWCQLMVRLYLSRRTRCDDALRFQDVSINISVASSRKSKQKRVLPSDQLTQLSRQQRDDDDDDDDKVARYCNKSETTSQLSTAILPLIAIVKGAICSALHPADPLSLEAIFYFSFSRIILVQFFFFQKDKSHQGKSKSNTRKEKEKKSRFFSVPQRVSAAGMYINKWQLLQSSPSQSHGSYSSLKKRITLQLLESDGDDELEPQSKLCKNK